MPTLKFLPILACLVSLSLTSCSKDEPAPQAPPVEKTAPPSPTPSYTKDQIEESLIQPSDIGKRWSKNELLVKEFKEGKLRGCSLSGIEIPGRPERIARKYGEPDHKLRGANYAQFVAVYPSPDQASEAFEKVKKKVLNCPSKKSIPIKHLPNKRFLYPHEDTWKVTESEISGWKHIRGFEKAVYPTYISIINVYYMPIDYALKGNVIFSSFYWQRVTPKDSGEPIAKKATEVLTKQLNKFG